MHMGVSRAEYAAADFGERHAAAAEMREQLIASLLAAPVGAGLPVGAIHRAIRRLPLSPSDDLRAARMVAKKDPGPVRPR